MSSIHLLIPAVLVIFVSFLVVRSATIALMMTGMDSRRASFQALSAFTGTGFTTKEAEFVMNHPQRRRIISWVMILGNVGIVTIIVSATSSIVISSTSRLHIIVIILAASAFGLYMLITRRSPGRRWERFFESRIAKSSMVEESVTEDLLHLIEGYGLIRVILTKDSPLVGIGLSEVRLNLRASELLVLGIERGNHWIAIPRADEILAEKDRLVVYGQLNVLRDRFREEQQVERGN